MRRCRESCQGNPAPGVRAVYDYYRVRVRARHVTEQLLFLGAYLEVGARFVRRAALLVLHRGSVVRLARYPAYDDERRVRSRGGQRGIVGLDKHIKLIGRRVQRAARKSRPFGDVLIVILRKRAVYRYAVFGESVDERRPRIRTVGIRLLDLTGTRSADHPADV